MSYKNHVISTQNELLTSPFGLRINPITKTGTVQHDGIDIVDANGKQRISDVGIIAIADGVVTDIHNGNLIGYGVDILHAGNILTRQYHFKYLPTLKVGDKITKGQQVGIMGTTGSSTGIHLHFAVKENSTKWNNGCYVDPELYLRGEKTIGIGSVTSKQEKPALKSVDEIAKEVIRGNFGNGQDRIDRLTAAGYDYKTVQARVNQVLVNV